MACTQSTPNSSIPASQPAARLPSPFVGSWTWNSNDADHSTFDLTISQQGDSLRAAYCGVWRNGSKIDCSTGEDVHERLSFAIPLPTGNSFETPFYNYFTGEQGRLYLQLQDSTQLRWVVTGVPGPEFYTPRDALLKRAPK